MSRYSFPTNLPEGDDDGGGKMDYDHSSDYDHSLMMNKQEGAQDTPGGGYDETNDGASFMSPAPSIRKTTSVYYDDQDQYDNMDEANILPSGGETPTGTTNHSMHDVVESPDVFAPRKSLMSSPLFPGRAGTRKTNEKEQPNQEEEGTPDDEDQTEVASESSSDGADEPQNHQQQPEMLAHDDVLRKADMWVGELQSLQYDMLKTSVQNAILLDSLARYTKVETM